MSRSRIRVGRGRAMIELDSGMHDLVERVLTETHGPVVDRLEEEAETLHDAARSKWPVRTGNARDSLDHGLRLSDPASGKIESFVGIDTRKCPYAYFIREADNDQSWKVHVLIPGKKRIKQLSEDLGKVVVEATKGSRR